MPLDHGHYTINVCWHHGRALFKSGFCTQCVSNTNAEESDTALEEIAFEQREAHPEVGDEVFPLQPTHSPIYM